MLQRLTTATSGMSDEAYFGAKLTLPSKPNLLLNAERDAERTRAEQRAARANLSELSLARAERPGSVDKAAIAVAEEASTLAGRSRAKAGEERDRRRMAFSLKAREMLAPAVDEYKGAVAAKIDELEDLLRPGLALAAACAVSGIEPHRYISSIRVALAQLHEIRQTLRGS